LIYILKKETQIKLRVRFSNNGFLIVSTYELALFLIGYINSFIIW